MKKAVEIPLHGPAIAVPEDPGQDPQLVYFQQPKPKKYPINWIVVWQTETGIGLSIKEQSAMTRPLTQTEYRVRDWLLGTIGVGNYVLVNQTEIAEELRINKVNVCKAIKRLVELGILLKGVKSGRSNSYMINPAFCFCGQIQQGIQKRNQAIKQHGNFLTETPPIQQ